MVAKFSNLAVSRERGLEYRGQYLIEAVQFPGMLENFGKSGALVAQQVLNAVGPVGGFCG